MSTARSRSCASADDGRRAPAPRAVLALQAQPALVALGLQHCIGSRDSNTVHLFMFNARLHPGWRRERRAWPLLAGRAASAVPVEPPWALEPGPAPCQPPRSPQPERGRSWMLVDARRRLRSLGRRHSAPHAHLPSLPGASSSAQAFAVYCLIIDIILQMAFGPANGITGVILLLVNYNQFVWDAFPVFVCNCSPHSLMTVTQQKLCSFAQG